MYNLVPWDVSDFSGGITDNYIEGRKDQCQFGDNLVINDNKKPQTRDGSAIVDAINYLPGHLAANDRTNLLFEFEEQIFEQQSRGLYFNDGGYETVLGPSGNPTLPSGTSDNRSATAYWNHHQILVNDSFCKPQKLYKDGAGDFQIRTAGLPKLATSPTILGKHTSVYTYINALKVAYEAHRADATMHIPADTLNTITAPDADEATDIANGNIATLLNLYSDLRYHVVAHLIDATYGDAPYHVFHNGVTPVPPVKNVPQVTGMTTAQDVAKGLELLGPWYSAHNADPVSHYAILVFPAHTITEPLPSLKNYIYAFFYSYAYTVGSVSFIDYGPTSIVVLPYADAPDEAAVALSDLPVLTNAPAENYDTAVIKLHIYRTINAGQTLYYVGEVTNGTTTFNDNFSDKTIQDNNIVIYTDGGVVDNDPPPPCKYVTVVNDIAWYAHIKDGAQILSNRVRQSIQSDIDSCPETFYVDMEDEITGIGSIGIFPIVFCKKRIYRLEGFFDLTGRGFIERKEISRIVGCTSNQGIIVIQEGLLFPSQDGFYFTDGYKVEKISGELNARYSTLSNLSDIYGSYDSKYKRAYWAVKADPTSVDNDAFYIADLNYGIRKDTPFTTASGGDSFAPTALLFSNNELYRGDRRGYLLKHSSTQYVDQKIDTTQAPSDWVEQTIIYNLVSCATNFGSSSVRKWVPKVIINAKNVSNASIGINSFNNDSTTARALKEVRVISNFVWGDNVFVWGYPLCVWNNRSVITADRNFPARGLRCDYKQIQFTNSYTTIDNSDSQGGAAAVDSVAKTVTLIAPYEWISNVVDYYISFDTDDYETQYLITARTDQVITYSDPDNSSVSGNLKWIIKGYRKGDVLSLLNYSLYYAYMSDTQDQYNPGSTGENA